MPWPLPLAAPVPAVQRERTSARPDGPAWGDPARPHGLPGSYLNGVYEPRPLPYAEQAYGLPETGQEVINVTNGKLIRLYMNDESFDVRDGELRSHERLPDFRAGTLTRRAEGDIGERHNSVGRAPGEEAIG
jgi:trehalose/maltose hydrolase-like predicted phosphorylase